MLGGQSCSAIVSTKGTHDEGKVGGGENGGRREGGTKSAEDEGGGGVTTVTLHERAACTLLLSFDGTRDVTVRTCQSGAPRDVPHDDMCDVEVHLDPAGPYRQSRICKIFETYVLKNNNNDKIEKNEC